MADDPTPVRTASEPRRATSPVGGARAVDSAAVPRRAGDLVAGGSPVDRPPQREPERLLPKPLQRAIGFVILFSTVGLLSCQAFLD